MNYEMLGQVIKVELVTLEERGIIKVGSKMTAELQLTRGIPDTHAWNATKNGIFTLRSAFELASNQRDHPTSSVNWLTTWKILTAPRIHFFLWKCFHDSIMVKQVLRRRGLAISVNCDVCPGVEESLQHVLRDCPKANTLWDMMKANQYIMNFFSLPFTDWLLLNC